MSSGIRSLVVLLLAVFPAACGGGGSSETPAASEAMGDAAGASAPLGTASVTGSVTFSGTAPQRTTIRQDRDCQAVRTDPALSETVVVNDNGTLRDVFVHVSEGLPDHVFPTPSEPVVLDQDGCMYLPHVFGIQTGQTLRILNSDPFQHNVHGLGEANRPFNVSMPREGDQRERTFPVGEVMMHIKCDVHGWMSAWAGVVSHPYFAVTGVDGSFAIAGLPAGTYVIEAWHEEYGTTRQSVTVADGAQATVDFSFGETAAM